MCSKKCDQFLRQAANDGVEYDFRARKFVAKDGKEVRRKDSRSRSRSPRRDTYVRKSGYTRWDK